MVKALALVELELDRDPPLAIGVGQGLDVVGDGDAVAGAIRVAIGQEQRPLGVPVLLMIRRLNMCANTGTAKISRYCGMNSSCRLVGGKATLPRQSPETWAVISLPRGERYLSRSMRSRAVNEKAPLSRAPKARPPVEYGGPGQTSGVLVAPVGRPGVSRVILSSCG
jgi:hypothetical protein